MTEQRDKGPARRRFLRDAVRGAGGLAAVALLLGLQQKQSQARDGL
ncbi:quinol dehydrogenase, partial [Edwardsiella ictaluri]